jgi:hypothetical protein
VHACVLPVDRVAHVWCRASAGRARLCAWRHSFGQVSWRITQLPSKRSLKIREAWLLSTRYSFHIVGTCFWGNQVHIPKTMKIYTGIIFPVPLQGSSVLRRFSFMTNPGAPLQQLWQNFWLCSWNSLHILMSCSLWFSWSFTFFMVIFVIYDTHTRATHFAACRNNGGLLWRLRHCSPRALAREEDHLPGS